MNTPMIAAGLVVGLLIFLSIVSRYGPSVLLVTLFAFLPFPINVFGGGEGPLNVSVVDLIAAGLCIQLFGVRAKKGGLSIGPVRIPLTIFLLIALFSSTAYWSGAATAVSFGRMVLGTAVAAMLYANLDTRLSLAYRCFDAFMVGINVLSAVSVLLFATGGFRASQYALGINKNALGCIFGCGVVVTLTFLLGERSFDRRRTWLLCTLGGATIGLILALSRGAWISTFVAITFILFAIGNVRAFGICAALLVPAVAATWSFLPAEAVDYATNISSDTYVIRSRFDSMATVMDAFHRSPLFGVGIGLRKYVEPHNVLVLTLGETGIIGLIGFVAAFLTAFYTFILALKATRGAWYPRRLVIAGAAVFLVTTIHGCMDVYWRRGVGFMGWACLGIAVNILNVARTRRAPTVRDAFAGNAGAGTRPVVAS